jgi:hypothetical protein
LRRINGLISEEIPSGDRPPHVVIDNTFHIPFFNDGSFKKFQDENTKVSFYVGFSPMGMRAFQVTRGAFPTGNIKEVAASVIVEPKVINDEVVDCQWVAHQVKVLSLEQVKRLAQGLVIARGEWGAQVTIAELQVVIEASLGIPEIANRLEFLSFESLLRSLECFTFESHKGYCYVSVAPQSAADVAQSAADVAQPAADVAQPAAVVAQPAGGHAATNGDGSVVVAHAGQILGKMIKINFTKKTGFIRANSKSYWFRFKDAPEVESGQIKENDRVFFVPSTNKAGLIAVKIGAADKIPDRNHKPIGTHLLNERNKNPNLQQKNDSDLSQIDKKDRSKPTTDTDKPSMLEVQDYLVKLLGDHGGVLYSAEVGNFLNQTFRHTDKIHCHLGFKSLHKMLERFDKLIVGNETPHFSIKIKSCT